VSNDSRVSTGGNSNYDDRPDKVAFNKSAGQPTNKKKGEAVHNYVATCSL
jgi:hypothetical protein